MLPSEFLSLDFVGGDGGGGRRRRREGGGGQYLTSKAHEEAEEDGVEEAKADSQDVLMHHRRHGEHQEHGRRTETLPGHLTWQRQREGRERESDREGEI